MNPLAHRARLAWPLVLVALAGCDVKSPEFATAEMATESVALFKAGKGVLFSDETRQLFGVEIAEAAERPMRRRFEKHAEVYRAARGENPGGALAWCSDVEARALTVGQTVTLRGGPDREVTGRLVRLDAQAHAGLGRVEALIEFADPRRTLVAGAFVTATFAEAEARPVLAVPAAAVLDAADGHYVYTVNGSHLTRTRVKVGPASEGFIGIEDGLYAGDAVAARGVDNLWLVELSALKGGTPCCPVPKKTAAK